MLMGDDSLDRHAMGPDVNSPRRAFDDNPMPALPIHEIRGSMTEDLTFRKLGSFRHGALASACRRRRIGFVPSRRVDFAPAGGRFRVEVARSSP